MTHQRIVVETSTLPVEEKAKARDVLKRRASRFSTALSGTGAQARVKGLVVLCGGDRKAFEKASAVFPGFSRANFYLGEFGNGSRMSSSPTCWLPSIT